MFLQTTTETIYSTTECTRSARNKYLKIKRFEQPCVWTTVTWVIWHKWHTALTANSDNLQNKHTESTRTASIVSVYVRWACSTWLRRELSEDKGHLLVCCHYLKPWFTAGSAISNFMKNFDFHKKLFLKIAKQLINQTLPKKLILMR